MILGLQNGSRNQEKTEGIPLRVFWGGGPPKRPPKTKVFGSVFKYLKIADFYIIILLYIRFLLDYY